MIQDAIDSLDIIPMTVSDLIRGADLRALNEAVDEALSALLETVTGHTDEAELRAAINGAIDALEGAR